MTETTYLLDGRSVTEKELINTAEKYICKAYHGLHNITDEDMYVYMKMLKNNGHTAEIKKD